MFTLNVALGALVFATLAEGQGPIGIWRTVDDRTGKARGTVRIYAEREELFARIESSVNPKDASDVCDLCPDDRKNKPIIGLVIMRHMKAAGQEWSGGDIIDPDTGSIYRCKFKITENGAKVTVRGYLGVSLLGRSQIWTREP